MGNEVSSRRIHVCVHGACNDTLFEASLAEHGPLCPVLLVAGLVIYLLRSSVLFRCDVRLDNELTSPTLALVGMNVFAGILLAELFIVTSNGVHVIVRAAFMVLTPILLVLSLTLMSVPMVNRTHLSAPSVY